MRMMMNEKYIKSNERGEKWFQLGRIFSIQKTGGGFEFQEECDAWHTSLKSKEDAIAILEAAIDYVKMEDFGNVPE